MNNGLAKLEETKHHCAIYMLNLVFFESNAEGDAGKDRSQGWETDENAVEIDDDDDDGGL